MLYVILFVQFLWKNRPHTTRHPEWFEIARQCRFHLFLISKGLEQYTNDFNGNFPPSLEVLYPGYVSDKIVFHCPIDFIPERKISYLYTRPDKTDPDTMIVVSCERHFSFGERWKSRKPDFGTRSWGCNIYLTKNFKISYSPKKKISGDEVRETENRLIRKYKSEEGVGQ